MVGTSGSCGLRAALKTASARTLPLLMCGITEDAVSKAILHLAAHQVDHGRAAAAIGNA